MAKVNRITKGAHCVFQVLKPQLSHSVIECFIYLHLVIHVFMHAHWKQLIFNFKKCHYWIRQSFKWYVYTNSVFFFFGTGRDFTKQFACKTEKDFSFSIFIYKILKKKKKRLNTTVTATRCCTRAPASLTKTNTCVVYTIRLEKWKRNWAHTAHDTQMNCKITVMKYEIRFCDFVASFSLYFSDTYFSALSSKTRMLTRWLPFFCPALKPGLLCLRWETMKLAVQNISSLFDN